MFHSIALLVNKCLPLFFFSRELLEQVAEFEKSEFTSSNKKVEFYFNQIIIKCHVESWQMFKILSTDSLCLRENQNKTPTLFSKRSLKVFKNEHFAVRHQGSRWIALAVSRLQILRIQGMSHNAHPKVSQTRDVLERLLPSSLPPGNWDKTGTFAVPTWSQQLRRFHNADVTLAYLVWLWLHLIWFVV